MDVDDGVHARDLEHLGDLRAQRAKGEAPTDGAHPLGHGQGGPETRRGDVVEAVEVDQQSPTTPVDNLEGFALERGAAGAVEAALRTKDLDLIGHVKTPHAAASYADASPGAKSGSGWEASAAGASPDARITATAVSRASQTIRSNSTVLRNKAS